jgi:hypothetical protein
MMAERYASGEEGGKEKGDISPIVKGTALV